MKLLKWIKNIEPSQPNEVQAITGATISSRSVVAIINNGIEQLKKLRDAGGLK